MKNKKRDSDSEKNSKSRLIILKNTIVAILKDKKKIPHVVGIGILFVFSIVAIIYVMDGINKLYFNTDSEYNSEEIESKLLLNIIFVFLFLSLLLLGILLIKGKSKLKSEPPKEIETVKEMKEPAKTAIKHSILYLVLLPIFYIIFLIVGLPIVFHNRSDVNIFELQNFAFLPMFIMWSFMGSFIWKNRKISTAKEYFKKINYEYIISEWQITNVIRKIAILCTIGFLVIVFIFNSSNQDSIYQFTSWMIFSISFGMFNSAMFSYKKIYDLEHIDRFRLFMASSFCKLCLVEDKFKAKNITHALNWYSCFLKKIDHRGIKRIDKIVMRILAANTRNSDLEKLMTCFESDDDYKAINKIAEIMEVNVDELLEDETLIQKIKGWLIPFGAIAAIGSFMIVLINTLISP